MSSNNLSKTFRYVNASGGEIEFNYSKGFLISKPKGIDSISVSHAQSNGIDQIGATIQSSNIQPRVINIRGILVGEFQQKNKDVLLSVIRPDIWGRLYADEYFLDVRPTETPAVGPDRIFSSFTFSLIAPYPYWQSSQVNGIMLSGVEAGFKLPCNFSQEYRFGSPLTLQYVNVINNGQVPIPFTVTITANDAVVNPKITNILTGEFLEIDKSMVANERIVIETTHSRTSVVSSIDGDIRGALTIASNLYRLGVGDNMLKPEADSGLADMEVEISYSVERVGVTV